MKDVDFRWDQIIIYLLAFAAGYMIGHAQAFHWKQIEVEALNKQIERQSCDDINPFKGF